METRFKPNDYLNMHKFAKTQLSLIEKRIKDRAEWLCVQHPDVLMTGKITIIHDIYSGDIIKILRNYTVLELIDIIDIIEKNIESKHPHKQLEIKFEKE